MSINLTHTKVKVNQYGVYFIRFRVSRQLIKYFNKSYITKSLSTKDYKEALTKSNHYRSKYIEILKVFDLLESTQIQLIVDKYINDVLQQSTEAQNLIKLEESKSKSILIVVHAESTKAAFK